MAKKAHRIHHRVGKKMDMPVNSLLGFVVLFAMVVLFFFFFYNNFNY